MFGIFKPRCKAYLPKGTRGAGPYFGRCDEVKGHLGYHALERGMDSILFDTTVVRTAYPMETKNGKGV